MEGVKFKCYCKGFELCLECTDVPCNMHRMRPTIAHELQYFRRAFLKKTDSLFLEVVGTHLLHIFYLKFVPQRVNSMWTSISGKWLCRFCAKNCEFSAQWTTSGRVFYHVTVNRLPYVGKAFAMTSVASFTWQNTRTSCIVTATLSRLGWQLSRGSVCAGAWTLAPSYII